MSKTKPPYPAEFHQQPVEMLAPAVNGLFADLVFSGDFGNAAAIRLTQHGDDLLVGKSALYHRLFLSLEEPSFQKLLVQKSRAGPNDDEAITMYREAVTQNAAVS